MKHVEEMAFVFLVMPPLILDTVLNMELLNRKYSIHTIYYKNIIELKLDLYRTSGTPVMANRSGAYLYQQHVEKVCKSGWLDKTNGQCKKYTVLSPLTASKILKSDSSFE